MADLEGNLRTFSDKMDDLGGLELQTGVNLEEQGQKFDLAWEGIAKQPGKAIKAFTEQLRTLTETAREKGTDRTNAFVRDFGTSVQDLGQAQQELAQATAQKDPKALQRAQDKYTETQYRARAEYDTWRLGEVEQYKIAATEEKNKRKQAEQEVKQLLADLADEVGADGNEQYQTLVRGLQDVQMSLKNGARLSTIRLPGKQNFDPKKDKFSSYVTSWKRQNRIDETNLKIEEPLEKKDGKTQTSDEDTEDSKFEYDRKQLEPKISRRAEINTLKQEIKASRPVRVPAERAARTIRDTTAAAVAAGATGAALGTIASNAARATASAGTIAETTRGGEIAAPLSPAPEIKPIATIVTTPVSTTTRVSTPSSEARAVQPPTQTDRQVRIQSTITQTNSESPNGRQTSTEIIFTGKIGRRLEKNGAEFETVENQIIQLQAKLESQPIPDETVVQELNLKIEQAQTLQRNLAGDALIQIETLTQQAPDQAGSAAQAIFGNIVSINAFTSAAAANASNRSSGGGTATVSIKGGNPLGAADIENLYNIASATTQAEQTSFNVPSSNQATNAQSGQTIERLNQLIGQTPLASEGAFKLKKILSNHQGSLGSNQNARNSSEQLNAIADQAIPTIAPAPLLPTPDEAESIGKSSGQRLEQQPRQPSTNSASGRTPFAPRTPAPKQGQKVGTMPKPAIGAGMGVGAGLGGGGGGMGSAISLDSQRQQERTGRRRDVESLFSDTELSDSSLLSDETLEPLLQNLQSSYTDPSSSFSQPTEDEVPSSGGGFLNNPDEEARRVRVLQQQQHQTRRNFFGSTQQGFDVTPEDVGITPQRLGALEQATGLTPIRKGLTERLSGLGQTNFAEDQEDASARGLMQQQQGESRSKAMQEARQKLQQQTKDQIKRLAKQATQKAAAGTVRVGVETAQAVAGPEDMGITWLTLIAEMNLQLILKYVLKGFGYFASQAGRSQEGSSQGTVVNEVNDFANSIQTFWEDVITIWMDCCLVLATGAAMCGPFIIILIINLLILVGIINGANEITSQL